MKNLLLSLLLLVATTACKSKGDKEWDAEFKQRREDAQKAYQEAYQKEVVRMETFLKAIDEKFGVEYKVVKGTGRYLILQNLSSGEFVAYNFDVTKWDPATMTSFDQYPAGENDVIHNLTVKNEYVSRTKQEDVYGWKEETSYGYDFNCECFKNTVTTSWAVIGQQTVDDSYYENFYYGGNFRFENAVSPSKDLEMMAALAMKDSKKFMTLTFKNKYGLSTDRAEALANLTSKYIRMENQRELTTTEKDQFAFKSLGVSMNDVEKAMRLKMEGKDKLYDDMLKKAAELNRTSPEMIGQFFEDLAD